MGAHVGVIHAKAPWEDASLRNSYGSVFVHHGVGNTEIVPHRYYLCVQACYPICGFLWDCCLLGGTHIPECGKDGFMDFWMLVSLHR